MTTVTGPFPQGRSRRGPGFWLKGAVALSLMVLLGWVGIIAFQYSQSGGPIASISAVPKSVAKLVQEEPQFAASIWNVARPLGVAIGLDGTVYVTESSGEKMVRAFGADGTLKAAFSPAGSGPLAWAPTYVAVSPAGKVRRSSSPVR